MLLSKDAYFFYIKHTLITLIEHLC